MEEDDLIFEIDGIDSHSTDDANIASFVKANHHKDIQSYDGKLHYFQDSTPIDEKIKAVYETSKNLTHQTSLYETEEYLTYIYNRKQQDALRWYSRYQTKEENGSTCSAATTIKNRVSMSFDVPDAEHKKQNHVIGKEHGCKKLSALSMALKSSCFPSRPMDAAFTMKDKKRAAVANENFYPNVFLMHSRHSYLDDSDADNDSDVTSESSSDDSSTEYSSDESMEFVGDDNNDVENAYTAIKLLDEKWFF